MTSQGGRLSWLRGLVPRVVRDRYAVKFGLFILLLGLVVGMIGLGATAVLTNELERSTLEDRATFATSEASSIEAIHQQQDIVIERLTRSTVIESRNETQIDRHLEGLPGRLPIETHEIHYVDSDADEILASTRDAVVGQSIETLDIREPSDEIYQRTTPGATWHSSPYLTADEFGNGVAAVAYTREVFAQEDRMVVVTVPIGGFAGELQTRGSDRETTILVDGADRVILDDSGFGAGLPGEPNNTFGAAYDGHVSSEALTESGAQRIDDSPRGILTHEAYNFPDEEYLVAYAPVPGTEWVLLVHVPVEDAFGQAETAQQFGFAATVLAILVITLLGAIIGRNTALAITRLTAKTNEIKAGNLDVELETERTDEIGQLYEDFDAMRQALRERIQELSAAIEAEEATRRELAATNRELEEQQLITSVLNRLLRHNLRNGLTTIQLRSEQLATEDLDEPSKERVTGEIQRTCNRLLRQAEKFRAVERVVDTDPEELDSIDIVLAVTAAVETYESSHSHVQFDVDLPDQAAVRGGDAVHVIVENLIENAIEHNDRDDPVVTITLDNRTTADDRWIELTVADDGPGIPEMEIDVLERGEETPLEHGSGIGLWLVNWLVSHLDGDVAFEEREPRGTVVRVRLPPADGTA